MATLIAVFGSSLAYAAIIVDRARAQPVDQIEWASPMFLAVVASVVGSTLLGGGRAGPAGTCDHGDAFLALPRSGARDALLVIGILGALVLCAGRADTFWVAKVLYGGAATSAVADALVRIRIDRRVPTRR